MKTPEIEFQKALTAFQAGNLRKAKEASERLLKKKLLVADTAHLLALIYKQSDNPFQSARYFEVSLKSKPDQSAVLSNYANLLADTDQSDKAEKIYQRATSVAPDLVDAWYNWAVMLNAQMRFAEALDKIEKAIALKPDDARLYLVKGQCCRGLEDFDSALSQFNQVLDLALPDQAVTVLAHKNLAATLRELNRPEDAISLLSRINREKQNDPEFYYLQGCSFCDTGEFEAAEEALQRCLGLKPDHIPAHEALTKLYWEQYPNADSLVAYKQCLVKCPDSLPLHYSYASQLINISRLDEAAQLLEQAIVNFERDPRLVHALGALKIRSGEFGAADILLGEAIKADPTYIRAWIEKANLCIRQQDYLTALSCLDSAGILSPLNQEIWAFKGLCWRFLRDARYEKLNDYGTLVSSVMLETPEGYDNLEHFLHELRSQLSLMHKATRQPLDQSVRNGTQTIGRLLSFDNKVIQDYRQVLSARIKRYVENLPVDADHPFLSRNSGSFKHEGSWSVKLSNGGYHTNHVHPLGWLSNCSYISLPDEIRQGDQQRAGWIKFGETALQLGDLEQVDLAICPEEGMSVLFPSYMWHGTYSFSSNMERLTLPSDIAPA